MLAAWAISSIVVSSKPLAENSWVAQLRIWACRSDFGIRFDGISVVLTALTFETIGTPLSGSYTDAF